MRVDPEAGSDLNAFSGAVPSPVATDPRFEFGPEGI